VDDFRYAHFDNDYYERRNLVADGHHVSDHDPPVLTLALVPPPSVTVAPAILGNVKRNHWAIGFPGVWESEQGDVELTYRWLRCETAEADSCEPIPGETDLLYRVEKDDKRTYLRFEVTATGVGGETVALSPPEWIK
jgi:hypothetical protein